MKNNLCRILLIEDSTFEAALIQATVSSAGIEDIQFFSAQSLKEAEEIFQNNPVDAVLLDLNLPDSSGLETVRKAKSFCNDLPIIVLTGLGDEAAGVEAVRLGAEDYIVKGEMDGRTIIRSVRYAIERSRSTHERKKLYRTLSAISKSNQTMVHSQSEQDYLRDVCRIIREDCAYEVVWIGFIEDNAAKVVPSVYAGIEKEYFETLSWENSPIGKAIRTGSIEICRDIVNFPGSTSWREDAKKWKFESSIILPLRMYEKTYGVLAIYSKEPDSFTEEEVKLLSELADDLAYSVMAIRLNAAHKRTEEALFESEEQYRSLFNTMTEGFALHEIVCDDFGQMIDYRFLQLNPAYEKITGLQKNKVIGELQSHVLPGEDPKILEIYSKVALTGQAEQFENFSKVQDKFFAVYVYSPKLFQFAVLLLDITAKKKAEERLKCLQDARYNALVETQTDLIQRTKPDGTITFVNDAFCKFFGVKREELTGRCFSLSIIEIHSKPEIKKCLGLKTSYIQLLKRIKVADYVCKVSLSDGAFKWLSCIDRALFNDKKELEEIQSLGKDITEDKEMEQTIQEKEKVIEEKMMFFRKIESLNHKRDELIIKKKKFLERFTEREKQLIKLLVQGLSYKEISTKLKIKEKTVDTHAQNIYQKAEVTGRGYLIGLFSKYETEDDVL